MSTQPTIEVIDLTEMVHEVELPCDYSGDGMLRGVHDDPARWVMWTKDHGCGVKIRLACDTCKESRLMNRIGIECEPCGYVEMDAASAYSRIEAL